MKDKEKQKEFEERVNCGIAYCEDNVVVRSSKKSKEILDALNSNESAFTEVKPNIDNSMEKEIIKKVFDKEKQMNRTDNFEELSDTVSIPNKEKTISISKFEDIKLTIPFKKEIEEMADILCESKEHNCNGEDCKCLKQATDLFNKGARILPKDSVVLSREELHEIEENAYQVGVATGKKVGGKETAEKFVKEVDDCMQGCDLARIMAYRIKELAKQFGVEIKE